MSHKERHYKRYGDMSADSNSNKNTTMHVQSSGNIQEITSESEWDGLLSSASDRIVIVDIYADWCSPCKAFEKPFEDLASRYTSRTKIFRRANVDNKSLGRYFKDISGVPTILFFRGTSLVSKVTGVNMDEITEKVRSIN